MRKFAVSCIIGWRRASGAALAGLAALAGATTWLDARASDQNWQAVVVFGGPSEAPPAPPAAVTSPAPPAPQAFPQAPVNPNPAARPVLMRPGQQSIPPWPQPLPQDVREVQLLNGNRQPIRVPGLVTSAGPEVVPAQKASQTAPRRKGEPPSEEAPAGQQYCFNVADAAADARFAWQQKTLLEIEQELEKRVALLEKKTEEYRVWLARREEFVNKAQDGLVKIYSRMRPDAAALQIAAMDDETGAALMSKLDPRTASAIMSEMDPAQAARLSGTIAGAARTGETREQAAANARALQGEAKQ